MGSEVTYGIGGQVPHDLDYMFTKDEENNTRPKFVWGDVGMGDGFEDAQSIVGQRGGGRDTKYQYHYMVTENDKDAQRIAGESGEGDHIKYRYHHIPNERYPLDRLVYQVGGWGWGWGGVSTRCARCLCLLSFFVTFSLSLPFSCLSRSLSVFLSVCRSLFLPPPPSPLPHLSLPLFPHAQRPPSQQRRAHQARVHAQRSNDIIL